MTKEKSVELTAKIQYLKSNCERIERLDQLIGLEKKEDQLIVSEEQFFDNTALSTDMMRKVWEAERDYIEKSNETLLKEIGRLRAKRNILEGQDNALASGKEECEEENQKILSYLEDATQKIEDAVKEALTKEGYIYTPLNDNIKRRDKDFAVFQDAKGYIKKSKDYPGELERVVISAAYMKNPTKEEILRLNTILEHASGEFSKFMVKKRWEDEGLTVLSRSWTITAGKNGITNDCISMADIEERAKRVIDG